MYRPVSIGGPTALVVLGAILYFALNAAVPGVNMEMIGLILMAAGVVWSVFSLTIGFTERSAVTTERSVGVNGSREREVRTDEV